MKHLLLIEFATVATLLLLMLVSPELGYRSGSRVQVDREDSLVGAIEGAILGMVGLLLAFSFSSAGSRFIERQDLIVHEASALSSAYLSADFLDEPEREHYRRTLRDYTDTRLELFRRVTSQDLAETHVKAGILRAELWDTVVRGSRKTPQFSGAFLPPLKEVIVLDDRGKVMMYRHIPLLILTVLIMASMLALATLGYSCGLRKRRYFGLTSSLGVLVATVLWMVVDFDYPRAGLLKINAQPFTELRQKMSP